MDSNFNIKLCGNKIVTGTVSSDVKDAISNCHTEKNGTQWLLITANGYPDVDQVIIYNRINDNQDRINGASLLISHDPTFSTVEWQASFGYSSALVYNFTMSQPGIYYYYNHLS